MTSRSLTNGMRLRSICRCLATRGYVGVCNRPDLCTNDKSGRTNFAIASISDASRCCRNYSSDLPSKCWKCDFQYKSDLFCSKCRALQEPPENLNYFQIIGVKRNYDLKSDEIHKKYRELQHYLHPDRFSNSTEKEKELSENLSSLVNKAYSTLSHPLSRGLYMLALEKLEIPEGTTTLDPEFLMTVMEKNEEIEAATDNAEKVMKLIMENREILADYTRQVSIAFREKNIELAKKLLVKMKYYASMEARLKNLKENLGIVE
ncbi:iron-sulfur cluster co-chaperone protein HscB [Neodiprion fabricii]|uniref:iron-sulfur cluster co-chaperone protein HscB n=1 Tax=Neodiprion fabricii TaxID=2872261 RepID=UPI001ED971BC|nr:iron-sulfur cluster co-chaperone protein HscB [Neodiprion fabricii]